MNLLAIETSSTSGSVALTTEGRLVASSYLDIRITHSERILPQIEWCLEQGGLKVENLDAIIVSNGPGSFTGLRIGLSTAKGLCYSRGIPLIPLSTAEIVAYGLYGSDRDILVLLDAKMNEVHAALFTPFVEEIEPIWCEGIAGILERINRPVVVVGEGALRYRKEILAAGVPWRFAPPLRHHPQAIVMAEIMINQEKPLVYDFATISTIEPFYLRKSQAETVRAEKLAHGHPK